MPRLILLTIILSIAFIVAGLVAALIGVVVALLVDPSWLWISLGGVLLVAAGVGIAVKEAKKVSSMVKTAAGGIKKVRSHTKHRS